MHVASLATDFFPTIVRSDRRCDQSAPFSRPTSRRVASRVSRYTRASIVRPSSFTDVAAQRIETVFQTLFTKRARIHIVKIRSSRCKCRVAQSRRRCVRTLNADFFAGADALVRRASTVVLIFCAFCVVLDATRTPVKLEVSIGISLFVCRNVAASAISRARVREVVSRCARGDGSSPEEIAGTPDPLGVFSIVIRWMEVYGCVFFSLLLSSASLWRHYKTKLKRSWI